MGWATALIERLQKGETVQFRPTGNSMTPKIRSKQLCTVAPIDSTTLVEVGDIVLCKVNGREYLHMIKATRRAHQNTSIQYQIGNNHGGVNGWTGLLYGKLVRVED